MGIQAKETVAPNIGVRAEDSNLHLPMTQPDAVCVSSVSIQIAHAQMLAGKLAFMYTLT